MNIITSQVGAKKYLAIDSLQRPKRIFWEYSFWSDILGKYTRYIFWNIRILPSLLGPTRPFPRSPSSVSLVGFAPSRDPGPRYCEPPDKRTTHGQRVRALPQACCGRGEQALRPPASVHALRDVLPGGGTQRLQPVPRAERARCAADGTRARLRRLQRDLGPARHVRARRMRYGAPQP